MESTFNPAVASGEMLVFASPLPIISLTASGEITSWNPAAERVFGWSADEVLGKQLPFIPEASASEHRAMRARDLSGQGFNEKEISRVRRDGRRIDLLVTTNPVRDETGVVTGIVCIYQDITEKKAAAQLVRDLEERQRLALDAGRVGLWDWNLATDRITWSSHVFALHGLGPSEQPESIAEYTKLIHSDDLERVTTAINQSVEAEEPYELEFRIVRPNREVRWIAANGKVLRDADGKAVRMLGAVLDITDSRGVQEQIAEANDHNVSILNQATSALFVTDRKGNITFANEAATEMFQWQAEELIGRQLHETLHYRYPNGAPYPISACPLMAVLREASTVKQREELFFKKDASSIAVSCSCSPIRLRGEQIGAVMVVEDITERKAFVTALQQSQERLDLAVEVAGIGIFDWDMVTGDLLWSEQQEKIFGMPPGSFPGDVGHWLHRIVAEDRVALGRRVEQAGLRGDEKVDFAVRIVRPDGNVRWIEGNGRIVYDEDHRPRRMVGVNMDLTERRKTEAALRAANSELEEFAYVASHDLQEPLRTVRMYTELLLKRFAKADKDAQEFGQFIAAGVDRMQRMITDLLSYSKSIHEDEYTFSAIDLNQPVNEAIVMLKDRIAEAHAVVSIDELPRVLGEASSLVHVFQNLIANSLKYRHRERAPKVQISAELSGNEWIVRLEDNGIGFEPEYASRIFGLFKRLYKNEYPGTGLGLAICKRIVERQSGRIWAEGHPGQGSTFFIALRALQEP